MKTLKLIIAAGLLTGIFIFFYSCSSAKSTVTKVKKNTVYDRSGAQLWGENCIRCHSIPSPASYNDTDWSTIGLHMKVRANLTENDAKKIFEFIKSAN